MAIDSAGVIALIEQWLYNQFFVVVEHAFIVQANQFGCFACKHATVDKCKFSHDEIGVCVVTCRGQWNRITVLCAKC